MPHYPESMRKHVSLCIDPDFLAWFRRQVLGFRKRINTALRAFVEMQRRRGAG